MERKKYDFMLAIVAEHKQQDFLKYQKKHSGISFNRCARGFCLKFDVDYHFSWFEIKPGETEEQRHKRFFSALKANWLED